MSKSFRFRLQYIVYKDTYVFLICQFLSNTSLRRHAVAIDDARCINISVFEICSMFKYIFYQCSSSLIIQRSAGFEHERWENTCSFNNPV